jgi:hypothetical protein
VIGDYGLEGPPARAVADLVQSWRPDFVVTVGDNNYPNGAAATIDQNIGQYYHDFIAPYQGSFGPGADRNHFFPTLGNHDYVTPGAAPYLDYFTLPGNERYYTIEWGPVAIFAVNSNPDEPDGVGSESVQAAWLRGELERATACWRLVFLHHAPFSSGLHGPSGWSQWPYAAWGADAVLAGHDHHYERLHKDGIPYFVNGLGGGSRYKLGTIDPDSQVRFNGDHGAMLVEAEAGRITFRFVTVAGEEIDSYTLEKSCPTSAG